MRNSSTRVSVTESSNITAHLRRRCRVSCCRAREAPSSASFRVTPNSVTVQFRVLNRRSRNSANKPGSERQVSTSRRWNRGDAPSGCGDASARASDASGPLSRSAGGAAAVSAVVSASAPTADSSLVSLDSSGGPVSRVSVCLCAPCPNPAPRHSLSRMFDTGIQKRESNALSSAGTIASRASSFFSNTSTYSRYCRSTEMLCSIASRMSGFTTRSSWKCRTNSRTTECSPGIGAANAPGANGGSPRRSAWNESMSDSRWYAGTCGNRAPRFFSGSSPTETSSTDAFEKFSCSARSDEALDEASTDDASSSRDGKASASASASTESAMSLTLAARDVPGSSPAPRRAIADRSSAAPYDAAANIAACWSGRWSTARCHQHSRAASTVSSRSARRASRNLASKSSPGGAGFASDALLSDRDSTESPESPLGPREEPLPSSPPSPPPFSRSRHSAASREHRSAVAKRRLASSRCCAAWICVWSWYAAALKWYPTPRWYRSCVTSQRRVTGKT